MAHPGRSTSSRYEALHASRRALRWTAPLLRWGLYSAGVAVFLDQVRPLLADGQFTWGERRVMGVVGFVTLGGFAVAGWLAGRLVRAGADLCEVVIDGAEAAVQASFLLESQVAPALVRAASALERLAETGVNPRSPAGATPGSATPAELIRESIRQRRWGRAEHQLRGLPPGDPHTTLLAAELARARQDEADRLLAELDAARGAGDASTVLDCRDALTTHLRGGALDDLDRKVVRWLYERIQDAARAGAISAETAGLAVRVADTFEGTAEAAALLDALPRLRRRAGLCAACGRPHRGTSETCPDCQAQGAAPGRPASGAKP